MMLKPLLLVCSNCSTTLLMTAEMDGDKVTKLTTYDIMTEEVTGVYAPDNGGSGNGNGGNGEGGDPTDPGDETAGPNLWWLWVLIAIIVICGGGAAYYFFVYKKKKAE